MILKRFCPKCKSEDVDMVASGLIGTWMCNECGYTGGFPEKEITGSDDGGKVNGS
jgi:ribosomal protein L37AE/L43A